MTDKPLPWRSNRRVAAMEPEYLLGEMSHRWMVCDRYSPTNKGDPRGKAMTYGCEGMLLTVMDDHMGWVVVNDRGQFLRSNGWTGDNRRIRRFKTPQAAAAVAETIPLFTRQPRLTVEKRAVASFGIEVSK